MDTAAVNAIARILANVDRKRLGYESIVHLDDLKPVDASYYYEQAAIAIQSLAAPQQTAIRTQVERIEWSGTSEHVYGCCPLCERFRVEGHEAGCRIAALVALYAETPPQETT